MKFRRYIKLDTLLKVLNVLRTHKNLTCLQIATMCHIGTTYTRLAIEELNRRGFIIQSIEGVSGCYVYIKKINIEKNLKRLSKKEITDIIDLYKNNIAIKDICEISNKSKECIYYHLKNNNIKLHSVSKNNLKNDIEKLYNDGMSIKDIAGSLNISYSAAKTLVYRVVEGSRRNHIDKNKVLDFIKNNKNLSGKELARRSNISESSISNFKKLI